MRRIFFLQAMRCELLRELVTTSCPAKRSATQARLERVRHCIDAMTERALDRIIQRNAQAIF